jgi:membrane protease YdiL (CAAX protease family)
MSDETVPAFGQRATIFLRSVLPTDPAQLLLLAGATFLFISPQLRWWPDFWNVSAVNGLQPQPWVPSLYRWASLVRICGLPLVAAGALGYFACFRRLKKSLRALRLILALALAGVVVLCGVFFFFFWDDLQGIHSIFDSYSHQGPTGVHQVAIFLSDLGPGFRFASGGFLLVAVFAALVWRRRATLPLRLPSNPPLETTEPPDENPWDLAVFVPTMIGLTPLLAMAVGLVMLPIVLLRPEWYSHMATAWIAGLDQIVDAIGLALFVLMAMGKERRGVIARCLGLPSVQYAALAVLLTAAEFQVWPVIAYLRDRIAWAQTRWIALPPPRFLGYFGLPQLQAFWLLIPALVEEFAWRGYLQPIFIQRYGRWRGIFLVGIVWGAFHFSVSFRSSMSDGGILIRIAMRLAIMVAVGYVLAWLTLRSGSILPAAIAHGIYDAFLFSPLPAQAPTWFLVAIFGLLGYVLFRYWPPIVAGEGTLGESVPEAEAIT